MRKLSSLVLLTTVFYFEVYGTGQPRDFLQHPQVGVVTTELPATLGPFPTLAECERYRVFYEGRGVATLGCRAVEIAQ